MNEQIEGAREVLAARQLDIEVEAEFIWVMRWRDGLLARWEMFMSLDDALEAARSERREPRGA